MTRRPRKEPDRRPAKAPPPAATASPAPDRRAARPGRAGASRPGREQPRASVTARIPDWAWPALLGLGLVALFWSCRGAPLGTAVADDYTFLYRLRFQRPLDPFDSMGAAYYWRPFSRQLYFSAVGGWLLAAPIGAAVINTLVLVVLTLTLYRVARRGMPPPVAAAIAAFPIVSEPARVLIGWPSGAQHLLASAAAALALHEALAGRRITAGLAALAGVLSHELAGLVLPVLPLIAWSRSRDTRETLRWTAVAAAVATLWAIGYAVAFRHGVGLPHGTGAGYPFGQLGGLFGRAVAGALNLEDLPAVPHHDLAVVYAVLFAAGFALIVRRRVRVRLRERAGVLAVGLAGFVVGVLPLALVQDWNAWRAWIPALAFGLTATAFLGLASPWLAGGFVALRLTGLLLAATAPPTVLAAAPETVSQMSFPRLARLQRTVESTRRELVPHVPRLRPGGKVRYWWIPRLAEFGFQGPYAVRVWYGDTTLTWEKFGGAEGYNRRSDALVEYVNDTAWPALVDEAGLVDLIRQGRDLMEARRFPEADSVFARALEAHRATVGGLRASIIQNRARVAFNLHNFDRSDSLNHVCLSLDRADADAWALAARIAMVRNQQGVAESAVRMCLTIDGKHTEGVSIAKLLGVTL
jgi:hypothetical protein